CVPFHLDPTPHRPSSSLFPYTTLFRSSLGEMRARALELDHSWWTFTAFAGDEELAAFTDDSEDDAARAITVDSSPVEAFRSDTRSEEHTSELQSRENLVCRLLLENNKT